MPSRRTDLVTIASLVAENATLAKENATLRLGAGTWRIMPARGESSAAAALFPTIPADEDYELVAWVEVDLNRYSPRSKGSPDTTHVKYLLDAGREGGAWRLLMQQVVVEDTVHGNDILGPPLIDVTGQIDGPEPLALLQGVLGRHLPLNQPQQLIGPQLRERDFAALKAMSPAEQGAVIDGLQGDLPTYQATRKALRALGDAFAPEAIARGLIDADA